MYSGLYSSYSDIMLAVHADPRACQVFLNIVLDEALEEKADGGKLRLGMVVRERLRSTHGVMISADELLTQVIRGNSVVMLEALERIGGDDRNRDRG